MVQFDLKRLFRVPSPSERLAGLGLRPDLARAAGQMASDERSDREVKQLELCLLDTESVISVVEGRHGHRLGLLALTTERLIFRAHGTRPGESQTHPLAALGGVTSELKSMTSGIVLHLTDPESGAFDLTVDKVLGTQGAQFADAVRHQLAEPGPLPVHDPVQELLDLRDRRAAGSISERDFQAAKLRLLDEL
ncbi:hypothetical protein ABIB25_002716 [Nakamurella sp. UYEF19]|uniref:hypothetical protein n=1 Tax=Nakamurella sp. UYEF19 TaxID=1756392 RepID=UPI0033925487